MMNKNIVLIGLLSLQFNSYAANNPASTDYVNVKIQELRAELERRIATIPAGAQGPQGPQGTQGPQGPQGPGISGCTGNNGECKIFATASLMSGNLTSSNAQLNTLCGLPNTDQSTAITKANCICFFEGIAVSSGAWRAWLSSDTTNAVNNIGYSSTTTYIRPDGTVIANPGGLTTGTLVNSISAVATDVFTGTIGNGTFSDSNCTNWTTGVVGVGLIGNSAAIDSTWTNFGALACSGTHPLYCVERAA